jgi:nucleoside-diphosphate-sugar epimerase
MSRRVGSNEKARRLLGWEASISIEDGLRTTVDWIRRTS